MEAEDKMILRDLPVDTRNYTILDNITGKPVEQSSYSLTIDPEVINKLNKLKAITEEKIRQASLKSTYSDTTLVETFTPEDNSVFSPLYEGEYIDVEDFNRPTIDDLQPIVEETQEQPTIEEPVHHATEVITQEGTLERVVARDPSTIPPVEESIENSESIEMEGAINIDNPEGLPENMEDSSPIVIDKTGLEEASEQIVKIDTEKLGPAIKPPKQEKPGRETIDLDRMEVREGKGIAWFAYILFFIPLLFNRGNRYVRLHANSGLRLNLLELLGGILFSLQYLLTDITGTAKTVVMICGLVGLVVLVACVITLPFMIMGAMFGKQFQVPWLWKKRMIHVNTTRD